MFHFYNIILLSLFFTYSLSNDIQKYNSNRTNVPSRSIYELVQIRRTASRLAARLNRTHRNNHTNTIHQLNNKLLINNTYASKMKTSNLKTNHQEFLIDPLKIVIIISCFAVGFMIILVIICIGVRYYRDQHPRSTERIEQQKQGQTYRTTTYTYANKNTGKFSRKPRTLPTAV